MQLCVHLIVNYVSSVKTLHYSKIRFSHIHKSIMNSFHGAEAPLEHNSDVMYRTLDFVSLSTTSTEFAQTIPALPERFEQTNDISWGWGQNVRSNVKR